MAISAEHPPMTPPCRTPEPPPGVRLQQLIDSGTLYIARNLTAPQFATLQAIASRIIGPCHPEHLAGRRDSIPVRSISISSAPAASPNFDFRLGLDELDTITRTRTSYAFAELPDEIQDAILGLVTSRDLTSRSLDLTLWLEDLHRRAALL